MRTNEGLKRIWIVAAREFRKWAWAKAFQLGTLGAVLVVLMSAPLASTSAPTG